MNKKKIIILVSVILLVISIVIGIVVINNKRKDNMAKERITAIVKNFYENTYYLTSNKELLKDFTNKGINISLEELIEFEEKDFNEYKEYDTSKSNITIYPIKPYDKKDYTIEIKLYRN